MALYDLHEHQQEIVRKMASIVEKTGESSFLFIGTMQGSWVQFLISQPGEENIVPCKRDDLLVLESEGLVLLRNNSKGELGGGSVRKAALDAVKANFQKPLAPSLAGAVYQTFYAPVGAVHAGQGNISINTQSVGLSSGELGDLITAMRDALDKVPVDRRADAAESLEDLESELRAQVPKQSKIKGFLLSLWSATKDLAEFGAAIVTIANAYGIDKALFGS